MDFRKFFLTITSIISPFLFVIGLFMILYFNSSYNITEGISSNNSVEKNPVYDILNPYKSDLSPVNILILGGDKLSGNTDTMLLMNLNHQNSKVTLLSIPRDTKVSVKGSTIPKINSAYPVGGAKLAVDTVSSLFNVKINYYAYLDVSVFRQIIDLLDGIDYNIPVDMDYDDPFQNLYIHLKQGQQHLNGAQAEQFMRFRQPNNFDNNIMKYYNGSDIDRIQAQQGFISELIRQKANIKYATKANDIVSAVFSKLDTNISIPDALKFVPVVAKLNIINVKMLVVPGEAMSEGYSYFIYNKTESESIINQYFR